MIHYLGLAFVGVVVAVIVWVFNNHAWGGIREISTQTTISQKQEAEARREREAQEEEDRRARDLRLAQMLRRKKAYRGDAASIRPVPFFDRTASGRLKRG